MGGAALRLTIRARSGMGIMSNEHRTIATRRRFQPRLEAWLRRAAPGIGAVVVAIQWVVIAHRRATNIGDFDVSREFGRRFLAGEHLYAGGLHYPYMPSAAMYFSPLALVPPWVGIVLRYAVAAGCVWLTLRLLHAMVRGRAAAVAAQPLTLAALTLVLASHYIIRDLDDGGPHLILLAMLVAGVFCASKGRDALAAVWFGLATALKAPAALIVPFLLWKRQWRLATFTALATACWIMLPAVRMGPASWWAHQREWTVVAWGSIVGKRVPVAEDSEQRVQNQALRPALLRYLVAYPEGHPLRLADPADVPALDLEPGTANALAMLVIVSLLAACAWWARRQYDPTTAPEWPLECSAVLILTVLLSPVTWTQHMVMVLPALYLIVAEDRGVRPLGTPALAAMSLYVVLALLLNREMLGRERYLLLLSYHTQTLCMLLLLGVVVLRRPTVVADRIVDGKPRGRE